MMILLEPDKSLCFSGPRPVKYDYSDIRLAKINAILHSEIIELLRAGYDTLIFGAAPGFDLISAKVVLKIKEEPAYRNIRLICALPFEKFSESKHFDDYWRKCYNEAIPYCEIINVGNSIGAYSGCFRQRNYFMIDNSSTLICLHNGKQGGTGQTHLYASKKGRQIINIYKRVEKPDEE